MKIKNLKLFTTNLRAQKEFYAQILDLKIKEESVNSISFHLGDSTLEFEQSDSSQPYHFAINIPSNKIEEALQWLKGRVDVVKCDKQEIQEFESWNASAIYFYDVDKNIVEFIARKNLKMETDAEFNIDQLLGISEIGVPTDSIEREFQILYQNCGIQLYSGSMDHFCALGDEQGLFICIDKKSKVWFPTNDVAYSSNFELLFEQNDIVYQLAFRNEVFHFLS